MGFPQDVCLRSTRAASETDGYFGLLPVGSLSLKKFLLLTLNSHVTPPPSCLTPTCFTYIKCTASFADWWDRTTGDVTQADLDPEPEGLNQCWRQRPAGTVCKHYVEQTSLMTRHGGAMNCAVWTVHKWASQACLYLTDLGFHHLNLSLPCSETPPPFTPTFCFFVDCWQLFLLFNTVFIYLFRFDRFFFSPSWLMQFVFDLWNQWTAVITFRWCWAVSALQTFITYKCLLLSFFCFLKLKSNFPFPSIVYNFIHIYWWTFPLTLRTNYRHNVWFPWQPSENSLTVN